jgi:hypothetical protein
MIKTFTQHDVLRAQSGEMPAEEKAYLESILQESEEMESFWDSLEQLKSEMENLICEPGDKPLASIMAFVKSDMEKRSKKS